MSTKKDDFSLHFGRRLRLARKEAGLSQADLAHWCGVSRETLGKYERGEVAPPADVLMSLITGLEGKLGVGQIDVEWLLVGGRDADERQPLRVRGFGALIGLTFDRGGQAEIAIGAGDVVRLLRTMLDLEVSRTAPNGRIVEGLKLIVDHIYGEDHDAIKWIAEVPIAVHGVKLRPFWPGNASQDDSKGGE